LRGEEIPLVARISAIADNWEALPSDHPYRPAWPRQEAEAYLRQNAGTLFDPKIVKSFPEMMETSHV